MKATFLLFACASVLLSPTPLLACGGCTDAVLLMTSPWAGYGILLVWLWIFTMLAVRWRLGRSETADPSLLVRGWTLAVFGLLGSVGYVGLCYLTMGSLLLPSLCIGFVWAVYLAIRFVVDAVRLIGKGTTGLRAALVIHGAFLAIAVALIAYWETKANTLEYCIGCLRYGRHAELYSKVMPRIVADGEKAVGPLIRATDEALDYSDDYTRMNTLTNATFCLACIGGPDVERHLSELLRTHANPDDYYDLRWYRGACFAYARCAGPRAVDDLVALFEKMPYTEERDDRAFLLVALVVTGSKRGILFALDHMDLLLQQMRWGGDGSETRVAQAAVEGLVFGTDPVALTKIPVYRDCHLMGAVWLADPRPNDYTSEFYWTASSESGLRPAEEIEAAWKEDSASIRKRWEDRFEQRAAGGAEWVRP